MHDQPILLPENELHLWHYQTDHVLDGSEQDALYYLDAQERERYQRFLSPNKRRQFLTSRVLLKQLLSRYLGKQVDQLALQYSLQHKPFIEENIHFNISHSGKHLLIGVALHAVGVDIQEESTIKEDDAIKGLSLQEQQQLEPNVLYPYWVLKEAVWKVGNQETQVTALLNVLPFVKARKNSQCSFLLDSCCVGYGKLFRNLHMGWAVNYRQPIVRFNGEIEFLAQTK